MSYGTPSPGQILEFGSDVLKAMPRDLSPESIKYWNRHRKELAALIREALLKPGSRVVDIRCPGDELPRLKNLDIFLPEIQHAQEVWHDPRLKNVNEVSINDVQLIDFQEIKDFFRMKEDGHLEHDVEELVPLGVRFLDLVRRRPELTPHWKAPGATLLFYGTQIRIDPENESVAWTTRALRCTEHGVWVDCSEISSFVDHKGQFQECSTIQGLVPFVKIK